MSDYWRIIKTKRLTWKRIEQVIGPCDRSTWKPGILNDGNQDGKQLCGLAPGIRTCRTWIQGPGTAAVINIVRHSDGYCIFPGLNCDSDNAFRDEVFEKLTKL